MADEEELGNPEEEMQPESQALVKKDAYDELKTTEPERKVDLPETDGHKSLDEAEGEVSTLTDVQASLRRLFPQFESKIINKVAQAAMVARIAPDVFLDMIYLTVTSIVEELDADGKEDIDVQGIINLTYAAFSIGLDGKGRIDALELAGSSRESEELEKLSKGLGFS